MFASVEDGATNIAVLARSRLPLLLRQLGAATASQRRLRDIRRRIRWGSFNKEEAAKRAAKVSAASLKIAAVANELDLKIEQFLNLASFAGSPPAYQQDLRESRLALGRLLLDGTGGKKDLDLATFTTLSHIVDLVELTRRDVQRRAIDDPIVGARFALGHLPADKPEATSEILGARPDELGEETEIEPRLARRVKLVAQLIYDLQFSHTPEGLLAWFHQHFPELDGRTPIDVLDEPSFETPLRQYARVLRSQVAT